jgi:hypothetical protein
MLALTTGFTIIDYLNHHFKAVQFEMKEIATS